MKFVDSFLEFLSHSKVIHLKRDILQRRSGLSGTISRIWAVSGLVGWWVKIDLTRTNQVERQSRRQILTQARTRFEQNYQILAPADILRLALGHPVWLCVFLFFVCS